MFDGLFVYVFDCLIVGLFVWFVCVFVYLVVMLCCLCCFVVLRVDDLFCSGVAVLSFVCLLDCLYVCWFVISRVCLIS